MFKVAVFCESNFENRTWKPGERVMCVAVFGSMKMDFRQAQLETGATHVICINIFGATRFRVPEDIPVNTSGISIFGKTKDSGAAVKAAKSDHLLDIACFNIFGTTTIIN